jgi:hypothetical protein
MGEGRGDGEGPLVCFHSDAELISSPYHLAICDLEI